MAGQVSTLAEELLSAAKSNRESLIHLIRGEVSELIESSSSLAKVADLDSMQMCIRDSYDRGRFKPFGRTDS